MKKVLMVLQILAGAVTVILAVLYLLRVENIQLIYCIIGAVVTMILTAVRMGISQKSGK